MEQKGTMVKLNALKHHLHFLRSRIERWMSMDWETVMNEMLELGENQFDLYTGELTIEQISAGINEWLISLSVHGREDLKEWLGRKGYRTLFLSDGSKWVVRESESPGTPAHIHPARNQQQVFRIKSNHIRTIVAVAYEFRGKFPAAGLLNTVQINHIRTSRVGLSPVRSILESRRILASLEFLCSPVQNTSRGS